jgi:hypothetical protein
MCLRSSDTVSGKRCPCGCEVAADCPQTGDRTRAGRFAARFAALEPSGDGGRTRRPGREGPARVAGDRSPHPRVLCWQRGSRRRRSGRQPMTAWPVARVVCMPSRFKDRQSFKDRRREAWSPNGRRCAMAPEALGVRELGGHGSVNQRPFACQLPEATNPAAGTNTGATAATRRTRRFVCTPSNCRRRLRVCPPRRVDLDGGGRPLRALFLTWIVRYG